MVYRLGWIAGGAALILALARMQRLLRPSAEGPPWELALIAAAVLGLAISWTVFSYGWGGPVVFVFNGGAFLLAASRIAAPDTTWLALPTAETFPRLGGELAFAYDILRHGTAPVLPVAGLVVLAAAAFWALGVLLVWGLMRGHPHLALVSPLLFYLQLAVIDHRPAEARWEAALLIVVGAGLAALAADERNFGAGLLTRVADRTRLVGWRPEHAGAVVAGLTIAAMLLTAPAAALVPRSGILNWRTTGGLGGGFYGGIAYNPFVSIRQQLVSQSDTPVFRVRVEGDVQRAALYWRLLSLDTFDGESWYAGELAAAIPQETWEDPEHVFAGSTVPVTQDIYIEALRMEWLPALYSPVEVRSGAEVLEQGFRVRPDGALRFDALTYPGLGYQVTSQVPQPDLRVLASLGPGALSPLFQRAAAEGATALVPVETRLERRRPPDVARLLDLPEDLDPEIRALARRLTLNTATDFEQALVLETWFRDPAQFAYSTDIDPGHSADNLAAWLLDPESPNYHTGYCEQFATAMGVMARVLGIPSRVVLGFTPGEVDGQGNIVVRDRNAHAWVELWMDAQGWVRFDPTPRGDGINPATMAGLSFDPREYLDLPDSVTEADLNLPSPDEESPFADPGPTPGALVPFPEVGAGVRLSRLAGALLGVVIAATALPVYKWWRRRRRLARLQEGDITAAWEEIVDRLADLGEEPLSHLTPRELAAASMPAMTPLAAVYSEAVYGPTRTLAPEKVAVAHRALLTVESILAEDYAAARRLWAGYRLRSLGRRG
ncbi:MAG: transglutaminaseTgpA domain-containing protein [Acidimicrobiia bacterium]